MLFSSLVFIFFFLPITLLFCVGIFRKHRNIQNAFLCLASLFFYAWGEPKFVLVMILSIIINWLMGLGVDHYRKTHGKLIVFLDVLFNLVIIFIFKYLSFAVTNINSLFHTNITDPLIRLPIGISFFTFQAISYVVDIYRRKGKAQKNVMNVALYISFFPQLIAGPIVRYETIAEAIDHRELSMDDFSEGVNRFIIGLGKKVIIANNVAIVADRAFKLIEKPYWLGVYTPLTACMAWLGAIAYAFQIYYDFSGYSDMAIGLGKMFGFHFLENFNYPYMSESITEFWRSWHISLGTWFKDYLYIPLGGSRVKSKGKHIRNLFIVWFCTGLWHGANWTFIIWGLGFFIIIVAEKYTGLDRHTDNPGLSALKHFYTMFVIIIGWVLFRADSMKIAAQYIRQMFIWGDGGVSLDIFLFYLREFGVYLFAAFLFSMPVKERLKKVIRRSVLTDVCCIVGIILIFIVSVSFIVKGSYNPFIYFNF